MPFAVIFEVKPKQSSFQTYLSIAGTLKPLVQSMPGFKSNIRYASLTRPGTILSLSEWDNEKALIRWRTLAKHHDMQQKGRDDVFEDYRLRVGEVVVDGKEGTREDLTEVGAGKAVLLVKTSLGEGVLAQAKQEPLGLAKRIGLDVGLAGENGLVDWDVFEAVLTPGDAILLAAWNSVDSLKGFRCQMQAPEGSGVCFVRILRDYGMFDRREAPQYYSDAVGKETIHAVLL